MFLDYSLSLSLSLFDHFPTTRQSLQQGVDLRPVNINDKQHDVLLFVLLFASAADAVVVHAHDRV